MATATRRHQPARVAGCASHGKQAYDVQRRKTDAALALAKRIRSGARWQAVQAWVLAEAPLCADPHGHHVRFGETVLAVEVDHVIGLALRADLAFERSNLMPLCLACHAEKSAAERAARRAG